MNHSPRVRSEIPNHDDMKIPTKNIKVMEVKNPRPVNWEKFSVKVHDNSISYKQSNTLFQENWIFSKWYNFILNHITLKNAIFLIIYLSKWINLENDFIKKCVY